MSRMKKTGEVRVIGGQWKRTKLTVTAIDGLVPTPDRVKETLFNWLGQDLTGWRCLDVFAGTGALGFEAASRGAQEVLLLEKHRQASLQLKKIQNQLNAKQVHVLCTDGLHYLAQPAEQTWDLIFLDPPFGLNIFEEALELAYRKVSSSGMIYVESDRLINIPQQLTVHKASKAGDVHYALLKRVE